VQFQKNLTRKSHNFDLINTSKNSPHSCIKASSRKYSTVPVAASLLYNEGRWSDYRPTERPERRTALDDVVVVERIPDFRGLVQAPTQSAYSGPDVWPWPKRKKVTLHHKGGITSNKRR